jgi:hypothetical protein
MPINRVRVRLFALKQRFLAFVSVREYYKRGTQQYLSYKINDAHGRPSITHPNSACLL